VYAGGEKKINACDIKEEYDDDDEDETSKE
jgi:hypothetical protein